MRQNRDDAAGMATLKVQAQPGYRLHGLTESEARARRARGQGNTVAFETSRSYRRILRENAFTFVNILLFAIAIALIALGLLGDAVVTAGLVLINVVVGVVQEARAKRQLDRIALLNRPTATVLRDGREQTISPDEIVLGDLLVVRAGDQILVDGVIVDQGRIDVDESLLTGESDLVRKQLGDTVFSGSSCITGNAIYEARKVGAQSMAQQITASARLYRQIRTPLQHEVFRVIQVAAILMIGLSILVAQALRELYSGLPLVESVKAAAVIVGLVPQGLYFMVTLTYAMAAVRIAGQGALVQRTNAVESLSQINTLCMDKTGTLTTNRLVLEALSPVGMDEFTLRGMLADYAASTTAGNHTTDAIREACPGQARRIAAEVAFSSERKWSALALDDGERRGVYVLGAPEMLLPHVANADGVVAQIDQWTSQGLRVLLFVWQPDLSGLYDAQDQPKLPSRLTVAGLVSLRDELRPEAKETIKGFASAGIALKIISGDNPDTVAALARQAGVSENSRAVSGLHLADLNDLEFQEMARDATVFGRVTPQQKEHLIRTLRADGNYVGMIGDGVNDILALKQAQLAIAMRSGSQATRNVADLVLLNDSFAVLPKAFQEGQRILNGMQDILRLFLVRILYVALIIAAASLLGEEFPITPKHNAVLALLTVGIPVFALAVWAQPGPAPRSLLRSAVHFVVPAGLTIAFVGMTMYGFYITVGHDVTIARSALTTTTVLCGLILIPFVQPPNEAFTGGDTLSGSWRPAWLALAMFGLYALILYVPVLRDFYGLTVPSLPGLFVIGLVVIGWATAQRFIWRLRLFTRLERFWDLRHE